MRGIGYFGYYYVTKGEQEEFLDTVKNKLSYGEPLLSVLGLEPYAKYYAEKIYNGLSPVSSFLYKRVTGKDPLPCIPFVTAQQKGICQICGKVISKNSYMCGNCYKHYRRSMNA